MRRSHHFPVCHLVSFNEKELFQICEGWVVVPLHSSLSIFFTLSPRPGVPPLIFLIFVSTRIFARFSFFYLHFRRLEPSIGKTLKLEDGGESQPVNDEKYSKAGQLTWLRSEKNVRSLPPSCYSNQNLRTSVSKTSVPTQPTGWGLFTAV